MQPCNLQPCNAPAFSIDYKPHLPFTYGVMKLGIIGGTSLLTESPFSYWEIRDINTAYGPVQIRQKGSSVFLQRHGEPPCAPHSINHRANIQCMKDLGVNRIVALNSVGSLDLSVKPGSFVIPDDFISLWQVSTFYDEEMRFMVPEMDKGFAGELHSICLELAFDCRLGGTYIQTRGPRLETKAEIMMLRPHGHIIGMTMASEATLSMEYAIPYASLCSVDNYCNGIAEKPLTMDEIEQNTSKNRNSMNTFINKLLTQGNP